MRIVKSIEYNGRKYHLAELAREAGMAPTTLHSRLSYGWSVERAVSEPVNNSGNKGRKGRTKCHAMHWRECFDCKLPDCTRSIGRPLEGESYHGSDS